jgi:hypothetical protein
LRTRKSKAESAQETRGKKTEKRESRANSRVEIKGRDNGSAEEFAEKNKPISKEPVDMARVRKEISNMLGNSATEIAAGMIKAALAGELAPAKYLFEMAGLYPVTEETEATNPQEDSLAHILLKRMGLPIEPVIQDSNSQPSLLPGQSKGKSIGGKEVSNGEDTVK